MVDQEIEEFVALCASVLDDGEITEERAYELGDWLNQHEAAAEQWPCNQLIEPLQAIWADGAANPQELQRLARVSISLQEEWALRKGAMAIYYKSLEPAAVYSYAPKVPPVGAPLARTPSSPSPPERPSRTPMASAPSPPRERRSRWVWAVGSVAILLIAAGLFAAREMKSAHENPVVALPTPPVVRASPVPPISTSPAPARSVAVQSSSRLATPSSVGWTVITRQNVKAKAGKKEIVIPKGTTIKVIARSNSDLMISYKGESLTIPASTTTSSR